MPFNFKNSTMLRLVGRTLCVHVSVEIQDKDDDERLKGVSGLACCMSYYSSLVCLVLLLELVENLELFCLRNDQN
jgi:hypothetical protein